MFQNNPRLIKGAFLLLFFLLLTGCSKFVKEPVVTVKDLKVVSLDGGGAGMELCLNVQNPNSFDISLLGYSYNLEVLALPLANGGAREEIRFPSGESADLRIPIRISYGDLVEIFKRKPDPDKVPYQLSAGLDLKTPMGELTVPVHRKGTYAIPKRYRPAALFGKLADLLKIGK